MQRKIGWGLIAALLVIATPGFAARTLSQPEAEVKAAVEAHVKAYNKKDLTAIMAGMARIPMLVQVGNGPKDRRVGVGQTRAHYEWAFKERSVAIHVSEIMVGASGSVGWFAAYCDVKAGKGEEQRSVPANWTGVLEKRDGKWLFILSHYSYPVTGSKARLDLR